MRIFVQSLDGHKFVVEAELSDTIAEVKQKVSELGGPDPATQRLIFCGTERSNDDTLEDCGIQVDSALHLIVENPDVDADADDVSEEGALMEALEIAAKAEEEQEAERERQRQEFLRQEQELAARAEAQIAETIKEAERREEERVKLEQQLTQSEVRVKELTEELAAVRQALVEDKAASERALRETADLVREGHKQDMEDITARLRTAECNFEQANRLVNSTYERQQELQHELATTKEQLAACRRQTQSEVQLRRKAEDTIDQLQQKSRGAESEIQQKNVHVNSLEQKVRALEEQAVQLRVTVATERSRAEAATAERDSLNHDVGELFQKAEEFDGREVSLRQELVNLREELEAAQAEAKAKEAQTNSLSAVIDALQQELVRAKDKALEQRLQDAEKAAAEQAQQRLSTTAEAEAAMDKELLAVQEALVRYNAKQVALRADFQKRACEAEERAATAMEVEAKALAAAKQHNDEVTALRAEATQLRRTIANMYARIGLILPESMRPAAALASVEALGDDAEVLAQVPSGESATVSAKELRLMKNRESALRCRERKKSHVTGLESRIAQLEAENQQLREQAAATTTTAAAAAAAVETTAGGGGARRRRGVGAEIQFLPAKVVGQRGRSWRLQNGMVAKKKSEGHVWVWKDSSTPAGVFNPDGSVHQFGGDVETFIAQCREMGMDFTPRSVRKAFKARKGNTALAFQDLMNASV